MDVPTAVNPAIGPGCTSNYVTPDRMVLVLFQKLPIIVSDCRQAGTSTTVITHPKVHQYLDARAAFGVDEPHVCL